MVMTLSTGTFVNHEITSNDTSCVPMKFENSNELAACELVFPTKDDKMVTRCLDSWYVGDSIT